MKNKRLIFLIIAIIMLIAVVVFLVGRSFGFFSYAKEGETVNIISIKGIEIKILDSEADALNLQNAYPMTDSEGLSQIPFQFMMTNTSSRKISYSIKIEKDPEKMESCVLEDGTSCPELSTSKIKYSYKKNDGTYTTPKTLDSENNIIASDTIGSKEEITSSIILWIDSKADNNIMGHYFYAQIVITGEEIK